MPSRFYGGCPANNYLIWIEASPRVARVRTCAPSARLESAASERRGEKQAVQRRDNYAVKEFGGADMFVRRRAAASPMSRGPGIAEV